MINKTTNAKHSMIFKIFYFIYDSFYEYLALFRAFLLFLWKALYTT